MSRLEDLLEKQQKLETQIAEEKAKAEAEAAIQAIGGQVSAAIVEAAKDAKIDLSTLHGKFFQLTVADGKLDVSLVSKTRGNGSAKANGGGNGNGNSQYHYYLKDGRGPFDTVQAALDAMGIPANKRPTHSRWERLGKDYQSKIERREKPEAETTAQPQS